jgi:hypothetical protein
LTKTPDSKNPEGTLDAVVPEPVVPVPDVPVPEVPVPDVPVPDVPVPVVELLELCNNPRSISPPPFKTMPWSIAGVVLVPKASVRLMEMVQFA